MDSISIGVDSGSSRVDKVHFILFLFGLSHPFFASSLWPSIIEIIWCIIPFYRLPLPYPLLDQWSFDLCQCLFLKLLLWRCEASVAISTNFHWWEVISRPFWWGDQSMGSSSAIVEFYWRLQLVLNDESSCDPQLSWNISVPQVCLYVCSCLCTTIGLCFPFS